MSNGYLVAASSDLAAAQEIAGGFGLEVMDAGAVVDKDAASQALAGAANVGILLSLGAAQDIAFVELLRAAASKLGRAQLILVQADARTAFDFLPDAWPAMSFEEARTRAAALAQSRTSQQPAAPETPPAQPEPAPEPSPLPEAAAEAEQEEAAPVLEEDAGPAKAADETREEAPLEAPPPPLADVESEAAPAAPEPPPAATTAPEAAPEPPPADVPVPEPTPEQAPPATLDSRYGSMDDAMRGGEAAEPPPPEAPPLPQAPASIQPPPLEPPAPAPQPPAPAHAEPAPRKRAEATPPAAVSAPADATAFAPRKLRRGTPELVRIVIHQPRDLSNVIRAARKIDPTAAPAPQGMSIGEVAIGASIGVALEVRGAVCDGTLQRRTWAGEPIDFSFSAEAEADVRQAVFLARVFINDAQIGVVAFTRPVSGPAKKPAPLGDRVRLRRHKRVFLSYSSHDRETVSAIATAYQMAGVEHFWDRASLKSGEEWSPRLRREIDRADLFHLCWSRSAASSEWVEKEAEHALSRRRATNGKKPEITVQMLDGPPWAPHPKSLDSINFDDFVRAAIVGYARGEA